MKLFKLNTSQSPVTDLALMIKLGDVWIASQDMREPLDIYKILTRIVRRKLYL